MREQIEVATIGRWPARAHGWRVLTADGQEVAHGLDARTAFGMATAAAANGQGRQVVNPDGITRLFPAGTDPAYRAYLDRWPNVIDPRD